MRIVLVGAAGYGAHYLKVMDEDVRCFGELCGVVDPYAQSSPYYQRFLSEGIPVFDTLEDFYARETADLVMIASPIQFHERQCTLALAHGSHVLCEKPLTAKVEQALRIREARDASGKRLGVGFQWSFCASILRLKRNILDGLYGKPVCLKAYISWPRTDDYYAASSWKGRLRDGAGNWVLDSIVTNATAHYLHNIFFVLGGAMSEARMPERVEASLYRARPIETFDTCFLRGAFADGSRFFFGATHAGDGEITPTFHYAFEKADIALAHDMADITVHWKDGRTESLGRAESLAATAEKIQTMREIVRTGAEPPCGIETALPHLTVCNALFEKVSVHDFPQALIRKTENPPSVAVEGLCEAGRQCYETDAMPDALGFGWAVPPTGI